MTKISPSFDHAIYAVADLDTATADMARMLGYGPSWRGAHPGFGTANALFRLDNTYIELLAPHGESGSSAIADALAAWLAENGDGLFGMAFGVADIDAYIDQLRASGIAVADPISAQGTDSSSGAVRAWRNALWPPSAARGITSFAIAHTDGTLPMVKPEIARAGAPACVHAVDHIVVNTRDGDAAAAFYGDALGIRLALRQEVPQWGGDMLFFRLSHMSIEVVASEKSAETDTLWGIAFRTPNIDAAQARLTDAGVAVSEVRKGRKDGTRVCTVKSHCCGVPTLLIGPDA